MKEQGSRCANTVLQLKLHRYSLNRFDRREALLPNVWWTKTFLSWEVLNRSTAYLVQSNMNHWQHKATSDDGLVLIPVPRLPTDNNSQRHNSNLFKCTRHCSSNLLWSCNFLPLNNTLSVFSLFLFGIYNDCCLQDAHICLPGLAKGGHCLTGSILARGKIKSKL